MASAQIENLSEGRRKRSICYYDICFPEPPLIVLKPCFPGSIWTSLADGKQRTNPLFSFAYAQRLRFCCIKWPLSPPMRQRYFLLPHPAEEGSDRGAWWHLASRQDHPPWYATKALRLLFLIQAHRQESSFLSYHNTQAEGHSATEGTIAKLICQNTSYPTSPSVHFWENFLHGKI